MQKVPGSIPGNIARWFGGTTYSGVNCKAQQIELGGRSKPFLTVAFLKLAGWARNIARVKGKIKPFPDAFK